MCVYNDIIYLIYFIQKSIKLYAEYAYNFFIMFVKTNIRRFCMDDFENELEDSEYNGLPIYRYVLMMSRKGFTEE